MNVLPAPKFVDNNPAQLESSLISEYEALTGKVLYPAQVERQLINIIAYAQSRTLSAMQHVGEQLLVRTSSAPILDYLGELVGTRRLRAQPARTTLELVLLEPTANSVIVPLGTRVLTSDSKTAFITDHEVIFSAGDVRKEVTAQCTSFGIIGNGLAVGSVTMLEKFIHSRLRVMNISPTLGGTDDESDDAYRARIILAPEAYSTAGPEEAYIAKILAVHQDIIDVKILGPEDGLPDGHVDAYILTKNGMPEDELIALVQKQVGSRKSRPLTDKFTVKSPKEISYKILANLVVLKNVDSDLVLKTAQSAATEFIENRRQGLGRDIVVSYLISKLHVDGVYAVQLNMDDVIVANNEWANCTSVDINVSEVRDE